MNTEAILAGDRRRLAVCLVLAGALHAVVLVTVDIPEPRLSNALPMIEVVLRQEPFSAPRPEEADVDTASLDEMRVPDTDGTAPTGSLPTTPETVEPQTATSEPAVAEPSAGEREGLAASKKDSSAGERDRLAPGNQAPGPSVPADATTRDLARAIAAQAALSAPHLDTTATGETSTKVRRLTGPPSADPELAYYLDSWRRKVERVGNINYPNEARARGLSGTLRLLVVIDQDGVLRDARILESSGHELLDEGAVRIVNLAAPFSPFTERMRARIDLLEIERRWRFRKDRLTPMP